MPQISPFFLIGEGIVVVGPLLFICGFGNQGYGPYHHVRLIILQHGSIISSIAVILWLSDFLCIFNAHMYWHIIMSYGAYHYALSVVEFKTNKQPFGGELQHYSFIFTLLPHWEKQEIE
jgi:hypothetical protein